MDRRNGDRMGGVEVRRGFLAVGSAGGGGSGLCEIRGCGRGLSGDEFLGELCAD